ncbi:MAG TPA: phosphatase PAP2 family protein [Gemmatimonadaceae bacterium]|nr:phosphatase PAP2 family protein [Gemmatimonadaceae bacterium]
MEADELTRSPLPLPPAATVQVASAGITPRSLTPTVTIASPGVLAGAPARPAWAWLPDTRVILGISLAVAALVGATLLDPWAFHHVVMPRVYERDWGRALRIVGFLPTWAMVSIALVLCTRDGDAMSHGARAHGDVSAQRVRRRPTWLCGAMPLVAATTAGIAGELVKLVIRRERPMAHAGAYFFRSFADRPFSTAGLSTPSSHAIVAFGAAAMLARMYPRAAWLWYSLAAGCAFTRLLARAHYLSDVTLSAIIAWLVVAALWRWYEAGAPARIRRTGEIRAGT